MRTSQLKQPSSRIPSPGKGLAEITDSQTNARSKPSKMLPPTSLKHKLGAYYNEPEPKRKTLVERAGEPRSLAAPSTGTRPNVKGTSLVGASKGANSMTVSRNTSFSSSTSSRATSASRNTTFSSSVGPGARPASAYGPRPQTSMAFSQSTSTRPTSLQRPRAATAMAHHLEEDDDDVPRKGKGKAFDIDSRLGTIEAMYSEIKDKMSGASAERNGLDEAVALYKARVAELELLRAQLSATNDTLQADLNAARQRSDVLQDRLVTATTTLDDQARSHRIELDETRRDRRIEIDEVRREKTDEIDRLLRLHRDELRELERGAAVELEDRLRELERRNDEKLDEERDRRLREVQELESQITSGHHHLNLELQKKDHEIQNMRGELEDIKGELDREQTLKCNANKTIAEMKEALQKTGVESSSTIQTLESTVSSLRARIHFLESGSKAQSDSFAEMEARLQEAVRSAEISKQKLIKEETLRRILFNQVQELKGNIRVMCRIRPVFANGGEGEAAKITIPDADKESKELELLGKEEKSSLGNVTRKNHAFSFDRVFGPESQNQEVFEEISQLVQSALDGYNVCIFCYGQTGSGKTHTMSSADGMIPRATHQIYETATNLKEKGWTYTMEGSFVEVYNEEIHDLLGNSKDSDKKKHEIRHDEQKKQTVVTGLKTVTLDSPNTVESILKQAAANRSVASTKSNERSSRSHSVFILKLVGRNSTTNETSEGTLNLVDLAGSERLKQSGAEGDRMKETQNINKSLSCLGDVIGALGQGKEGAHIPYRNSKLTYLLQYSLGGNSKTLMFVMASPLEAHLSETLTSLKFATKVHNTHIGTAKKSTKVRERSCES